MKFNSRNSFCSGTRVRIRLGYVFRNRFMSGTTARIEEAHVERLIRRSTGSPLMGRRS